MNKKLLIKGGTVIDPSSGINGQNDLLIENGKVAKIAKKIGANGAQVIDAKGLVVAPGFIDLHVHFREPGYEYKETIETGAMSAAAGGFTAVCCMANTDPVNDNGTVTRTIVEKAEQAGAARVYPIGAVTKGLKGEALAEIGEMKEAGVVALSDDGRCIMDAGIFRSAMEYASMFGLTIVEHCEDYSSAQGGIMNEGSVSSRLGIKGIPTTAEETIASRDMSIAGYTGHPVHLAHLSAAATVNAVREAKKNGVKVTCEVAPHHFILTEKKLESFDPVFKMNPPLRSADDVRAIREGLADGTIDAIATDHAPHAEWEKELELDTAPFGVVGLETALALSLQLVDEGLLTIEKVIALLSSGPAGVFGLPGGTLEAGSVADISIFDADKKWVVDPASFYSKGRNTPFAGMEMKGKNIVTIVGGRIVYNPANL